MKHLLRYTSLFALGLRATVAQEVPPAGTPRTQFTPERPRPVYPMPYGVPKVEDITKVLVRVHDYLAANTPTRIVSRATGAEITDLSQPNPDAMPERSAFNLTGYEWGVTYSGMLLAAEATGDARFRGYVDQRMKFLSDKVTFFQTQTVAAAGQGGGRGGMNIFRPLINPHTLDDSGSMCAAMIKANRTGAGGDLRPLIDHYMDWIATKQMRLADGTFARNRPLPNSLWLDDLYMSVPALTQMGILTAETKYFDDAARQITQFAARMFNRQKNLWTHGWVEGMDVHPQFHWARANGWALLAMTELLDALPETHPARAAVLDLYRMHVRGLADTQGKDGRWHQLLDREDSYLETSATAIYAYCIAHGVNRGWLNPLAHGPMAVLAWNAVTTQVNEKGQVENVCVGTGMAFDPAFYYHRPVSPMAAHGYGPVLLAGAEIINLVNKTRPVLNDESVQFGRATGM